ncbi:protein DpdF [Streptomyces cinereoruber]|uniref:protein DpdF n=1 Tax=Streptomyces cinereoruber TaxID=67260 RepID=UPI003C30B887
MTAQFDLLQRILLGHPEQAHDLSGPYRRFADAWASSLPGSGTSGDIAALLGQVLRHHAAATGRRDHALEVPLDRRAVDHGALHRAGLHTERFGAVHHHVRLGDPWAPPWLHGDPGWVDLACASPGPFTFPDGTQTSTYARPTHPVPADPAVQAIAPGIDHYRSPSQASALRTAALADPTSTLHVVLPTGTGKSIVGLAPGLLRTQGTTVVVLPTIALALDLERHLHQRFPTSKLPPELAYYSGRAEQERATIKQRLREGTQRILLTSPEALTAALAFLLRPLAAEGHLTHFVIDEAHLVRTWGLSFRPDFQIVASLVEQLREAATAAGNTPPRIVLLTATLSAAGLLLNERLFAGSAESLFIGSSHLRTELRYLMATASSPADRIDRVVEAMHHLPRPAIVYTTKKETAETIAARLKQAGFARTAVFHGDTGSAERLSILRGWSGDGGPTTTDIVVGTSAFGLGVDQSDVRTVVHACIPASVDRYYQEVGRAGRDGHAALAVWLPAQGDDTEGQRIEKLTVIGDNKAWKRWDAMRTAGRHAHQEDGSLVLDTSVVPQHNEYSSDANQLWNRNTLVLMERAGLITFERLDPPAPERGPDESETAWQARRSKQWTDFARQARVRLRPHVANLDRQTFEAAVQLQRRQITDTESASAARIRRLLAMDECWGRVLSEEYSYTGIGPMQATQNVTAACSGCPADRHRHTFRHQAARPLVAEARMPDLGRPLSTMLENLAAGCRSIIVTYPDGRLRRSLGALVQACVTGGVRAITAPAALLALPAIKTAARFAGEGLVSVDPLPAKTVPLPSPAVPTLFIADPERTPPASWLAPTRGPLRVVVVPENMPDPKYPDEPIRTIRSPHWNIDDFLRRL